MRNVTSQGLIVFDICRQGNLYCSAKNHFELFIWVCRFQHFQHKLKVVARCCPTLYNVARLHLTAIIHFWQNSNSFLVQLPSKIKMTPKTFGYQVLNRSDQTMLDSFLVTFDYYKAMTIKHSPDFYAIFQSLMVGIIGRK